MNQLFEPTFRRLLRCFMKQTLRGRVLETVATTMRGLRRGQRYIYIHSAKKHSKILGKSHLNISATSEGRYERSIPPARLSEVSDKRISDISCRTWNNSGSLPGSSSATASLTNTAPPAKGIMKQSIALNEHGRTPTERLLYKDEVLVRYGRT